MNRYGARETEDALDAVVRRTRIATTLIALAGIGAFLIGWLQWRRQKAAGLALAQLSSAMADRAHGRKVPSGWTADGTVYVFDDLVPPPGVERPQHYGNYWAGSWYPDTPAGKVFLRGRYIAETCPGGLMPVVGEPEMCRRIIEAPQPVGTFATTNRAAGSNDNESISGANGFQGANDLGVVNGDRGAMERGLSSPRLTPIDVANGFFVLPSTKSMGTLNTNASDTVAICTDGVRIENNNMSPAQCARNCPVGTVGVAPYMDRCMLVSDYDPSLPPPIAIRQEDIPNPKKP